MKRRPYIYALILILYFAAGCKKDPAANAGSVVPANVKTESTTSASGDTITYTYSYDSQGRQVMSQTDTTVTKYTYSAGIIDQIITLAGENFVTNYVINAQGLTMSDSKGYTYTYDANGYRTKTSLTGNDSYDSIIYTISAGNTTSSTEHQADAVTNNVITTTYTYSTTTDSRLLGLNFLGMPNKNLMLTENVTQVLNGSTYITSFTYSYLYDSKGRVSQMVKSSGSAIYTTTYTYY